MRDEIRQEIRSRLAAAFRDRLQGVLLYGSSARGEEHSDSDLDLMVLLKEPVRLGKDLETIVTALYPVQLTIDTLIHAMPVSARTFEAGEFGILPEREARRGLPVSPEVEDLWSREGIAAGREAHHR